MSEKMFSEEQLEQLRSYPEIASDELIRYFTPTAADVAFVDPGKGRGPIDQLGMLVQLCTLPWLGFVPDDVTAAPAAAVARVAERLGVTQTALRLYGKRDQTRSDHLGLIAKYLEWQTAPAGSQAMKELEQFLLDRAMEPAGPLFRASIKGRGGPLSYDAAHHRWQSYCAQAGVEIDIHQLRHAHATELINAGVSIEAVRRRLGHASTETTQLYALLDDKVADAEIRAARQRRDRTSR